MIKIAAENLVDLAVDTSRVMRSPTDLVQASQKVRRQKEELRSSSKVMSDLPHRPNDWALSQAAFARRAMTASRVSSLAAESETNAATARCRPSGRVIMPMSLVAEVMPF